VIALTINTAPIPKGRPRASKSGHVFTPERTRSYEYRLKVEAFAQCRKARWVVTAEPVEVELRFFVKAMRADLDNLIKAIDAFNGVIWVDDRQIRRIDAAVFVDKIRPRTEVRVWLASEMKGTGT